MVSRLTCIILLWILILPVGDVSADDRLTAILDGITKTYGPLPGLTVPYERDIITKSMSMLGDQLGTDLATGKIHFKAPHFLRLQQETPSDEAVITDGDTLWWYIPSKKEAYQFPSHKLGRELKLLGDIFHGMKDVRERFVIELLNYDENSVHKIKLKPDPPWPQIEHIVVSVKHQNHHIKSVDIYNYMGSLTRFRLGGLGAKKEFEEDFFKFKAPEGVKVIVEEE